MIDKNTISIKTEKKIYLASDIHLSNKFPEREKKIIEWIDSVKKDASYLFFVGDIFDFWFEYNHCIPKGYSLFQSKLVELTQRDVIVIFFTGNHDKWMFDYFKEEFGISIYYYPQKFLINNTKYLIGHGDGLGKNDKKYKILKIFFENPYLQKLVSFIHPDIGISIGYKWADISRRKNLKNPIDPSIKHDNIIEFCKDIQSKEHHDYYIFGHIHNPLSTLIGSKSTYINLGDWTKHHTYVSIDNSEVSLLKFY